MSAIELDGVTKRYGDVTALRDLDLTVESGEVFGFLGPNGAGKSTTIDVLLGYIDATSGTGRVLGHDVDAESVAIRERTGVLPDGFGPLGLMTGREHLEFTIEAKDAGDDPDAILDRVGIPEAGERPVTDYSKGMAQRLMLGMALVGDPDLLVLDEPTTGLDPNGARRMREIVFEERDRGATVFFSSHILEQVEAVADRVGILQRGELVAVDSLAGLRDASGATGRLAIELASVPDGLVEAISSLDGVRSISIDGPSLLVDCEADAKGPVVHRCVEAATVLDVETSETSLDELFAAYTEAQA